MTIEHVTNSESETSAMAQHLASHLRGGEVLALDGPLGSGKTCFVRGLAQGLGMNPALVSSPTFVICQEYVREGGTKPLRLVHIDAYRLSGPDDLGAIGWDELLADPNAIIVIEWAARLAGALPDQRTSIQFEHVSPTSRRITLQPTPSLATRLVEAPGLRPPSLEGPPDKGQGVGESSATRKATKCPICGNTVQRETPTYPFCSPRCKLADLGRWFKGKYQVSRPLDPQDIDERE